MDWHASSETLGAMVSEIYMVPFGSWKDVERGYRSGDVIVEIRGFLMARVYRLVSMFAQICGLVSGHVACNAQLATHGSGWNWRWT